MIVAMVIIAALVSVYTNLPAESPGIARAVYAYRIFYSDIIMYKDTVTGRVYPGIVDQSKLTPTRLDDVFKERLAGASIAKIAGAVTVTPKAPCTTTAVTLYNDKNTWDVAEPMSGVSGKQGSTREELLFPITLRSASGVTCAALLNITVVRPNS